MAPPVVKLKFNIISYVCAPIIDCNNYFYWFYVLKSTFPFLIVKRKKNLSFWSIWKIHFLKFEENFVKTPQILIWNFQMNKLALYILRTWVTFHVLLSHVTFTQPRPFKFLSGALPMQWKFRPLSLLSSNEITSLNLSWSAVFGLY